MASQQKGEEDQPTSSPPAAGLWATYRWRKLRKTEDRVRALQERLRKLVETQEGASSARSVEKAPSSADKTTK
ncbi:hypothetical protein Peur_012745 [Populus x canadensis]